MKRVFLIISMLFLLNYSQAIDTLRTKSISVGIKLAASNFLIGFSGEYGGLYEDRISVITNISYLPEFNIKNDLYYKSQNYSIGGNYAFFDNRKVLIGLSLGVLKTKYIEKYKDLYYDINSNPLDVNLTYTTQLAYLKPSVAYNFTLGNFFIKPEIDYYFTNYKYAANDWKYELENGDIRDGRELKNLDFESVNVSLTLGYTFKL